MLKYGVNVCAIPLLQLEGHRVITQQLLHEVIVGQQQVGGQEDGSPCGHKTAKILKFAVL